MQDTRPDNSASGASRPSWFSLQDISRRGKIGLAVLVGVLVLGAIAWWLAQPPEVGDFYAFEPAADASPGELLRVEPFERDIPEDARGWRILYTTTGLDGEVRLASAIVAAARNRPAGPRPVVAWAHGTTGIKRGCAPSLLKNTFAFVPAWPDALAQGWIWVATDYAGLGTAGPHPYLVGRSEAYAVLDAVRAAGAIDDLDLSPHTVAWGHSQGGHAALWTGIVAPEYAPGVRLAGVAAVAPASDLVELVSATHDSFLGRMLSAMLVHGYSAAFPDVAVGELLRPWVRPLARDMAGRCMGGIELAVSAVPALLTRPTLFRDRPPTGAFRQRLSENTPADLIDAPVLIMQGGDDSTVLPGIQGGYVARRCTAGQPIDYRGFPGEGHLSIVGDDSHAPALLIDWTRARFAGEAAPDGCSISRYEQQ